MVHVWVPRNLAASPPTPFDQMDDHRQRVLPALMSSRYAQSRSTRPSRSDGEPGSALAFGWARGGYAHPRDETPSAGRIHAKMLVRDVEL